MQHRQYIKMLDTIRDFRRPCVLNGFNQFCDDNLVINVIQRFDSLCFQANVVRTNSNHGAQALLHQAKQIFNLFVSLD